MATNQATIQQNNQAWLRGASLRNFSMPQQTITAAGQTIDINLENVPGWAETVELMVNLNLDITSTTSPSYSAFAPHNFFSSVQVSLGGGPFINVNPFFFLLREMATQPGWDPSYSGGDSYQTIPLWTYLVGRSPTAGLNNIMFNLRIPLQVEYGSVFGFLPLGNADVTARIRLVVQPNMWGTDQYLNPLNFGSGVTVAFDTTNASYVQPNIWYRTTPPNAAQALPTPTIGYVLNVQEKVTPLTVAGSAVPIPFKDPFKYLRLWHIVVNGAGEPTSSEVNQFELDLLPGYPQFQYTQTNMQNYFARARRLYRQDLPLGVFVFDLWAGSDPANPNGTQVIDATQFQTMQTQIGVQQGTTVGSSAKIITYAEALAPVAF